MHILFSIFTRTTYFTTNITAYKFTNASADNQKLQEESKSTSDAEVEVKLVNEV